jgi:DivIVA domain-containing protein
MDRGDPERRIADLDRQLAEPHAAGDPGANRGSQQGAFTPPPQAGFSPPPTGRSALTTGGYLTPEQVRNVAFSKPPIGKRGYNNAEVDMFLDLVEAALRDPTARILTPEQIRTIAFSKPPLGKRGYHEAEVDAFLDRVEEQMKSQQGAAPPPPQAGSPPPMAELERQQAEAVGHSPQSPDAQMAAGRQSAAPDEPIRCVLSEVFNRRRLWRNALRLDFSGARPALAMDVGTDAIWVIDLTTNALIASARLAQVTATPKEHRQYSSGPDMIDFWGTRMSVLVMGVPGLPSLSIGPLPPGVPPERTRRGAFYTGVPSWRSSVRATTKYPTHVVTNADWLTLVEKFGLAPQLDHR